MNMFLVAALATFGYWLLFVLDESFAWQTLTRPIVVGPVIGFLMGDVRTGILRGALIESIYMGIVNSGGSSPADAFSATVICVTFVIRGGMNTEAALALALPIGTIMSQLNQFATPIHAYFVKVFDSYCEKGETQKFERLQSVYRFIFSRLFNILVLFFSVALGVDNVQKFMNILPTFILHGLQVAGSMLPAVGLGVLVSMVWSKEWGAFLLIGFVITTYLKLESMAVALIGISIAVIVFFIDAAKGNTASVKSADGAASKSDNQEEGFFS
jgi:mannose/fructose/N-acetylgalactosamine-specific phosphotransferase system component IIC